MNRLFQTIQSNTRRVVTRTFAKGIPEVAEIEQFGANGEDVIYRILREEFDCVLRGVIIPHKNKYLEKDFLILHKGVPIVIEVKNWKGEIGRNASNGEFYQNKPNGVHKVLKSPVGTTQQFIRCMKEFYNIQRTVVGMVVFAEPDCILKLPESVEGIFLVHATDMLKLIRAKIREYSKEKEELPPECILRCTRIYSNSSEFCKGILADDQIPCFAEDGSPVLLNTAYIRYLRVDPQPLRFRDKISVTYVNGVTERFYNHDTILSFCCLDGSCRCFALNKIRYLLF